MTVYPDDIVARVLWGEARGEGQEGIEAVAEVIANRCVVAAAYVAKHGKPHPLFGDGTPEQCVESPWQFSCLNAKDPNRAKLLAVNTNDPQFAQCLDVANAMVVGALHGRTEGALYYKTSSLPWPTAWGKEVPPVAVIGNQSFYDLP